MIDARALFAALLLPLASAAAAAHDFADQPREVSLAQTTVAVPIRTVGKPIVSATINGAGPFDFYLDTGAGATVLNADLVAELALPAIGSTRVGDPANPQAIEATTVAVKELALGGAAFRGFKALTWNRSAIARSGGPRGVIGMPLFHELLLTLDLSKSEVRIARGTLQEGAHTVRYADTEGGIFRIPLRIGKIETIAAIDSGSSSGISLPKRLAEELPLATPLRELGRGRTVNSEFTVYAANVNADATIAGHTLSKPLLTFNDVLPGAHFGTEVLRDYVLTIDQKNHLIELAAATPVSPVPTAATPPSSFDELTGRYGHRVISAEGGSLYLQRDGGPRLRLVAAGKDEFTLDGVSGARLRFLRNAEGVVQKLEVLNPHGQWETTPRS